MATQESNRRRGFDSIRGKKWFRARKTLIQCQMQRTGNFVIKAVLIWALVSVSGVFAADLPPIGISNVPNVELRQRAYYLDSDLFYRFLTNKFPATFKEPVQTNTLEFHTGPSFASIAFQKAYRQWFDGLDPAMPVRGEAVFFNDRTGILLARTSAAKLESLTAALKTIERRFPLN